MKSQAPCCIASTASSIVLQPVIAITGHVQFQDAQVIEQGDDSRPETLCRRHNSYRFHNHQLLIARDRAARRPVNRPSEWSIRRLSIEDAALRANIADHATTNTLRTSVGGGRHNCARSSATECHLARQSGAFF